MHPITNTGFQFDPRTLGLYPKPVSACFNGTIRPSKRKGVIINPNEAVETCLSKPRLFNMLLELEVPTPNFITGSEINPVEGFDYLAYDRQFDRSTAVLLHPNGRCTIKTYTDLVETLKQGYDWQKSVLYKQNDDFCFSFEIVASRIRQVTYKDERVDNVISLDYGQYEPDTATLNTAKVISTEVATKLEADFIRITFEWSPNGFYVTNATTALSLDTLEQAKAIIRRKIAMK